MQAQMSLIKNQSPKPKKPLAPLIKGENDLNLIKRENDLSLIKRKFFRG